MPAPLHSRLAPSSASRWTTCTASIGFVEANAHLLPKDNGSTYADEGTEAHAMAAKALLPGPFCITPNGPKAEMEFHVSAYRTWVRSYQKPGTYLKVEQRVPLFYLPEQFGTVDAAVISMEHIFIGDLKYGVGVSVEAEKNKQLAIYAESLIQGLETLDEVPAKTPVTLGIFQPRDRNNPEPIRSWPTTRGELRTFCAEIEAAAEDIFANKVKFEANPEGHCRFCPAKGLCKHYGSYGLEVISDEPLEVVASKPQITLPEANSLTREQRVKIISFRKSIEAWLEAVEDQEMNELLNGAAPLTYKLVEGKSNRQWVSVEEADQLLSNYLPAEVRRPPGELISPAQAEKALKGKETSTKFENRFAALITKPPGKPSLVPIGDKRPALLMNPAAGLDNIDVL